MDQYYGIRRAKAARAMIECERCILRGWRHGDEAALVALADNLNVSRYLRDRFPSPYRMSDAVAWIALNASTESQTYYAIEVAGALAGGIGIETRAAEERFSGELGYWLGEPFWGRGIMTDAVRALTRHAFDTTQLRRLSAEVVSANAASQRVLEKAGYIREGVLRSAYFKHGEFYDKAIYGIVREMAL